MFRPRLYDVRASGMPESVGLCPTDSFRIAGLVNEAQERLINDPLSPEDGWWGQWVRMAFNVSQTTPTIVAPREVARIILMDVCKAPVRIHNEFYEYLEFGRGYMPTGCENSATAMCCQSLSAYERETVITFTDLPMDSYIRAYAVDPSDVGRVVLIQGSDTNDQIVRFLDAVAAQAGLGEKMTLATPFATSVNIFSEITGIQKPKTFGEVQYYAVDPTTGDETAILVMQPGEETAQYRKYFVNGLPQNCCNTTGGVVQVLAMCKLDFVPVQVDTDYLNIASVPAIIEECMSIRYGRMDTTSAQQLSDKKHAGALRLLFGQLDHYLGKERTAISVPLFGSDPLTTQPV